MIKEAGDPSKEQRILEAARKVFTEKGFAATRTRDIAKEAGINLALLNYYFRSKEKLFNIVMSETRERLFLGIRSIMNDEETTINEKFKLLAERHIDTITENPSLPLFYLNEMHTSKSDLIETFKKKTLLHQSYLFKQLEEAYKAGEIKVSPLQVFMSYLGLTLFAFIGKPMIIAANHITEEEFKAFMEERKRLIPIWMDSIMHTQ